MGHWLDLVIRQLRMHVTSVGTEELIPEDPMEWTKLRLNTLLWMQKFPHISLVNPMVHGLRTRDLATLLKLCRCQSCQCPDVWSPEIPIRTTMSSMMEERQGMKVTVMVLIKAKCKLELNKTEIFFSHEATVGLALRLRRAGIALPEVECFFPCWGWNSRCLFLSISIVIIN